ncbi:helix-turn-helix domain-containing protein [Consotaella salsifontis]|uniref:Transcriptional regulator, AraC family n=1 Tax=Consotaella salsifontis TaxID=1365950 RepID=A0A1T4QZB9_9HYPH|nr:AraC family transcriptional regulator [Consotaella salsifontis]SKA08688.1 transcriptional regulator, AraC family [Consotaella salsifontis]
MPAIPLPFVISLLLAILLVRMLVQGHATRQPAVIFLAACTLLMTTVGLRWTFDLDFIRFLQPIVASLLPPIAWLCFSHLRRPATAPRAVHLLPVGLVALLSALWHHWQSPIDLVLALLYFGYGFALIRQARAGPDSLEAARLSDAACARRASLAAGWLIAGSGVIDLLIAADFNVYQGSHAASIVGIANLLTLPLVAYTIVLIGGSVPDEGDDGSPRAVVASEIERDAANEAPTASEDDHQVIQALDAIMRDKQLFRDPDLTLTRLSRRLGVPARAVSGAVNRVLGRNVSQAVNDYRIKEASRLLLETDLAITAIMFECGFQTKSNFNREFARMTGTTPSGYRRSGGVAISPEEPQPGTG